jgi:hypothetical protein
MTNQKIIIRQSRARGERSFYQGVNRFVEDLATKGKNFMQSTFGEFFKKSSGIKCKKYSSLFG